MFGYVTVNQTGISEGDRSRYQSCYCGLCRYLKKNYGNIGSFMVTYDMTFLLLLLGSLYEGGEKTGQQRCLTHPVKKRTICETAYTAYAGDMNILLAYHNCMDDWIDDRNAVKLSAAGLLRAGYKTIRARYPDKAAAVETYMDNIHRAEEQNLRDLDIVAGYTGELLGELFVFKSDEWSDTLRRMGFFLGKFIYLMDAYEDLEKDLRKDRYNPFRFYQERPDFEPFCLEILTMMMTECARSFERLPLLQDCSLLRNILYSGVWLRYQLLCEKKQPTGDPQ